MKTLHNNGRGAQVETLELRRLLSAAVAKVIGDSIYENDDHDGLTVAFLPRLTTLAEPGGFVTAAQKGRRADLARKFFIDHAEQFGISADDARTAVISRQYSDAHNGVTHVYMQQSVNGVPVQNAVGSINFTSDGRVINASSRFVAGIGNIAAEQTADAARGGGDPLNISAMIHPTNALRVAASALSVAYPGAVDKISYIGGARRAYEVLEPKLSLDPIPVSAQYVVTEEGLRLAWQTVLRLPGGSGDWYDISVDATRGEVVFSDNWTDHLASYNVFDRPTEAPNDGARTIVADPWDLTASPFGWHDTDGDIDPDFTDTRGNNVNAQEDADNNNSGGARPSGGAGLNFNFAYNGTQAPATNLSAATTNLFYWNNVIHDVTYRYGFNEISGNFQINNYGRGGAGNDAVEADSQDGSGTNNANFGTPPDGFSPRMQMFIWTAPTPDADSSFDNGIITHEYAHGISNRLTGGPADASALNALQSGGMGEGWSDFLGLMLTQKATDTQNAGYGIGTYVRGQPNTGAGIRRKPYSFDKAIDPLTTELFGVGGSVTYPGHAAIDRSTQVHRTGEIWASALWDMNWLLVNKHGFDGNLLTGYNAAGTIAQQAGNKLALQLVLDGMKLQPANPTFADARDAILQADLVLTGGANQGEIWQAFARRGMGFSFFSGRSAVFSEVTPAFDLPSPDPIVLTQLTQDTYVADPASIALKFSETMNTASFSVADDVLSFTGPAGANLLSAITGSSWSADSRTLTIAFTPQTALGAYSLNVGPDVHASDNGASMDQDRNGTAGQPTDSYTANFNYVSLLGPDNTGYQAGQWAFENLNLAPGQTGVTSVLGNNDDSAANISLGDNTFSFYETIYSNVANAVNASTNGFVSFGAASTVALNTDLTSPSAARVAGLWDDWASTRDADDQVLYTFQDLNNDGTQDRLVVEWNEIGHFDNPANGVTFQIILQLNSNALGTVIVNYVDLDAGDVRFTNGASATVGLKAIGTPPADRLLISAEDATFPWIGSGKAIRFSTDWIAPTATSAFNVNAAAPNLRYQFSESVRDSFRVSDLTVINTTTSQTVSGANLLLSYDLPLNTATITFPGLAAPGLPDGNYTATLAAKGVTDPSWMPLAQDNVLNFFSLAGDATQDRAVNLDDFTALAASFGQTGRTFTQGDFNYDGSVTLDDFTVLASQFGKTLPAPGDLPRGTGASTPLAVQPASSLGVNQAALPNATKRLAFSTTRIIDDVLLS